MYLPPAIISKLVNAETYQFNIYAHIILIFIIVSGLLFIKYIPNVRAHYILLDWKLKDVYKLGVIQNFFCIHAVRVESFQFDDTVTNNAKVDRVGEAA